MQTKLTELLGIKYPVIQGGMAWISESSLVSAVSNAGGAGVIGTGGRDGEWVKNEIRKTRELTNKPFGVNVVLLHPDKDKIIEVICKEKVSFVTLGAGNPVPYLNTFKNAGIKTFPVVPNARLARRVEDEGADAIILEGMEAGGHIGNQTTMALLTNVIPYVNLPVVAAGGIANGKGIAAALVMGAAGVQMGTRFLLTTECKIHPNIKEKIMQAADVDSVVTGYSRNHGVRGLKNKFTGEYLELETSGAPIETLNDLAKDRSWLSAVKGDVENGSVQAGQSLNVVTEIKSCGELIEELVQELKTSLQSAAAIID